MNKAIFILALLLVSNSAFAIKFYKMQGGSFQSISETDFSNCGKKYFRTAAKKQLSAKNQKLLVKALLKGQTKNDLEALKGTMKSTDGSCSYGEDTETF